MVWMLRFWKKYGKIRRPWPTSSINRTLPAMLGLDIRRLISRLIIRRNIAAVLSNNMSDIKQVTFFMEECRRMGLKVLGPDVNRFYKFAVNDEVSVLEWVPLKVSGKVPLKR